MKHNRFIYFVGIIGLAALIIMLTLFSPTEIGPFGVLLFFTTIYVVATTLSIIVIDLFRKIALNRQQIRKKDYLYAAVFAFAPIMLLMARSFGAVNLWTIGLITSFIVLAEFLVYKRI